jgi:fatty-acyl-CoA synthase
MRGLMMDVPLLVSSLLRQAAQHHGDTPVVSRDRGGITHRSCYAEIWRRSQQLAHALTDFGLARGDRVGTLAWNGQRHLELLYGVAGAGFVCHTINPRLFPEQICSIITHAQDRLLFVEPEFVGLLDQFADRLAAIEAIVVLSDAAHRPAAERLPRLIGYEDLLEGRPAFFDWPHLDENTASGLCYTSGTTGAPKGVLYSHRSCVMHALGVCLPDAFSLSAKDCVMPAVPMFHVNAWGLPYAAVLAGAKLVLPGPRLDGASLHDLITSEGVTLTAGVPTLWQGLLDHVAAEGKDLTPLRRAAIGGSACPPVMIERFGAHGVEVVHAWGMTETSPVALSSRPTFLHKDHDAAATRALSRKQGRPLFGIDVKILGPDGREVPADGASRGRLLVRGRTVAARYYEGDPDQAFAEPGWFDSGDVATIDADGFVEIVDRTKDVIKSGGEWIGSIELEHIALGHPAVREAAVVARPDARWGERPVLFLVLQAGPPVSDAAIVALFEGRVARWAIPTDIRRVPELPHTATGKLLKSAIRDMV